MYSCNYNFLKYQNNRYEVNINSLEHSNYCDVSFDYDHIKKDITRFKEFISINEHSPNAQIYWEKYLTVARDYKLLLDNEISRRANQIPSLFLVRKLHLNLKNIVLL